MKTLQSRYRLILEAPPKTKPFGALLSERVLLEELEKVCSTVWSLSLHKDGAIAFINLRNVETVDWLLGLGHVEVKGVHLSVKPLTYQPGTVVSHACQSSLLLPLPLPLPLTALAPSPLCCYPWRRCRQLSPVRHGAHLTCCSIGRLPEALALLRPASSAERAGREEACRPLAEAHHR